MATPKKWGPLPQAHCSKAGAVLSYGQWPYGLVLQLEPVLLNLDLFRAPWNESNAESHDFNLLHEGFVSVDF